MKRVLVAALTLTILLCSCGSGSSGSSAQSPASGASEAGAASAPQAEVSSDEKIEIGYMTWNGGAQQKGEEAFFEEYEASHPNITIAAQFIQYDNYYSKLNTLIAASSCPDIFFTSESNLIDYAEKGMALDLNELFQKDGVSMKDTFADGCYYESADGKIWSLSNGISPIVLFYNKTLFAELGIEPPSLDVEKPWTFEQFREAALKLTTDLNGNHPGDAGFDEQNIKTYGTLAPTHRNQLMPLLYSNNASFFVSEGGAPKASALDTPEAKTVLQSVADLMLTDKVAPTAAMAKSLPATVQMFKDNQLGMAMDGAWSYINFENEDYDVGVAPTPMFQKPVTVAWGSAYMLSSQSKNPEAAFAFMKDFLDPDINPDQIKYMLPNKKELYEGDKLQAWITGDFYNDDFQAVVPAMITKTNFPGENITVRGYNSLVNDTIMPIMDKLWLGEAAIDDVLAEADASAQALYVN